MEAKDHYTEKTDAYLSFVSGFGYAEGLGAFLSSSDMLRPNMRVLDAGCGTGVLTTALMRALENRGLPYEVIHDFDLTPSMLERFRQTIAKHHPQNVELRQADVLAIDEKLPPTWMNYDLIMSAGMLEYVPRAKLSMALAKLCRRIAPNGWLLLSVTRRNWITKRLIERKWQANSYGREELRCKLREAGVQTVAFRRFPWSHYWLNVWGHVVTAQPGRSN
jgi:2-polyprenyl-3-methyl-5-hydroxy-6-metoxy-1,4-benzoquinol methylase